VPACTVTVAPIAIAQIEAALLWWSSNPSCSCPAVVGMIA
jgi:hypothetical protein